MKARIAVEQPKIFEKIELVLESKEEAEVFWAFLAAGNDDIAKFLKDQWSELEGEHQDELVDATNGMFDKLDKCFTPKWYKDYRRQ